MVREVPHDGVKFFPGLTSRKVGAKVVLLETHVFSTMEYKLKMKTLGYSSRLNSVWSHFRNETSTRARHVVLVWMQVIPADAPVTAHRILPRRKKHLWNLFAPSELSCF
ncbi:hypothetical protein CLOM_g16637 [Closterium sp. NIES-68]|nr:hypothetical protein CLOM_g16637 [Closterium sp. NIES-68]GJP69037.1 hypothetical protein CLOP_g25665 [Closterium sp. NIES-67]